MGGGGGGRLFEAERLLTFSAFRMGAYSRWALILGWALIRINTVVMILQLFLSFFLLAKGTEENASMRITAMNATLMVCYK